MPRKGKPSLELVKREEFDGSLDGLARMMRAGGGDEKLEAESESRRRVVELLRGEEDMVKFVVAFDRMARRGKVPSLDEVAVKVGVNRSVAVGAIARVMHAWNFDVAKLAVTAICVKEAQPVAEAMVASAKNVEKGFRDRSLFMEAIKLTNLKSPGGSIQVNAQANAAAMVRDESTTVVAAGTELPKFEDGTKRMAAAMRLIVPAAEEAEQS